MDTTPVSLLERLRLPDQHQAWDRFVALYTPLLYQWARRVGLPEQDAGDLVQDVLLLLVRKLPEFTYQPGGRFRGWLWTVLLNKYRENRRRRDRRSEAGAAPPPEEIATPDPLVEITEAEYRRYVVGRALELMRRDFQPQVWRACWESLHQGRSAEDLAAELGMTPGAIRAARFRVLSRLRAELRGLLE